MNNRSTVDERTELEAGATHHRAGRLDAARICYERVLSANPNNPQALDLLGVVHAFQGRNEDSIAVLRRAIDLAPDFPQALNHLGLALKSQGDIDEAIVYFRRAIAVMPDFAEARINLGNALFERSDIEGAVASFREAVRIAPQAALAHNNLGRALNSYGNHDEAKASYRNAIAIDPRHAEAHKNLGELLSEAGSYGDAAIHLRRAVEIGPANADCEYALGVALARGPDMGARDEAPTHFERAETLARAAVAVDPQNPNGWQSLGNALLRLGRIEEAFTARNRAVELIRDPNTHRFDHLSTFRRASTTKLDHDIEQIQHLIECGSIDGSTGANMLSAYRTVRERLPAPASGSRLVTLSADDRRLIGTTYNKLWHVAPTPELSAGAVNPALDRAAIEADYAGRAPGITWLDSLLTVEALKSLRRFCLESSVWFTDTYANGYLGAFAEDGFACPLLLQIGRELPQRFPSIFGDHPLLKVWAFKYGDKPDGIAMHADFAAVNVNFWITPDDANLDPNSGGLVVWDKEAPPEWDFNTYNLDHRAMQQFIADSGAKAHTIPHRQNRAVIFNSDLIHRTDEIHFRPGYENRRINVTFLYGERAGRV